MTKNVLFNFIDQYLDTQTILANCLSLEKDSTTEEREYFRFELQQNHPVILQDEQHHYSLQNHHVSVYQTESKANPFLSQYHYTAYFDDENGARYQLHVYFNDKNEITTEPVFSIWHETEGFIALENEQLHEEFIKLARAHAKPLVKNIWEQLSETVKKLEEDYKKLDEEATQLSKSITKNLNNYIHKLNELAETAKRMVPLQSHDHYKNTHKFIQNMITAIKDRYQPQQAASQKTKPARVLETKKTNNEFSSQEKDSPLPIRKKQTKAEPLISTSEFDKTVLIMSAQLGQLINNTNDEKCATKLANIRAKVFELSLTLEDEKTVASLVSLSKLKNLQQKVDEIGKKLFRRLLLNNKFELAQKLSPFYYLLDNYLEVALQTGNGQLLDFILTHGDVNINNREIIPLAFDVEGTVCPSAVNFCFIYDNTDFMADCLSVLIKHGASVFETDDQGLPIAYTILSTNHPLEKAFNAQREKTLESSKFYKKLVSILKLYLKENQLDESVYNQISDAISHYQSVIEEFNRVIVSPNSSEKKLQDQTTILSDKHCKTYIDRLREEPEIKFLREKLQLAHNAQINKLTSQQRRKFAKMKSSYLENADKTVDHFNMKFDNYELVKTETIKYLNDTLRLIKKHLELIDVQKSIGKYVLKSHGRVPRNYTNLLLQQTALMDEIKEIEKKYAMADIEKIKEIETKFKDIFSSLIELSTKLKETDQNTNLETSSESKPEISLMSTNSSNVNNICNFFELLNETKKTKGSNFIADTKGTIFINKL